MASACFGEAFIAGPTAAADEGGGEVRTIEEVEHDYRLEDTVESRRELIGRVEGKKEAICFDIETTGLNPKTCELIGLAFSYKAHTGFYVPLPQVQDEALEILGSVSTHPGESGN